MGSISHSGGAATLPAQMGPFLFSIHSFAPFLDGRQRQVQKEPDTVNMGAESEDGKP